MGKRIDITGKTFGQLTVDGYSHLNGHGEVMWSCLCSCGNKTIVNGSRLRQGHTRSCGCLQRKSIGDRSRTHGMSKTPEFVMYYDAKKRAKKRGTAINIEPSDIFIPKICPVLGIPLIGGKGLKSGNTPTLDCIDPKLGYVKGNIQVVSWRFNKFKADLTPEEMKLIANWVLK